MNDSKLNWDAIIRDAVARLEWVAAQTSDPERQSALLPLAGDGPAVEMIPAPAAVRAERRKAITRERMSRLLGQRKDNRWAGRETGSGGGVFNPADITGEQAAALLVVVRAYVRRWAGPYNRHPLSPEAQEDTVSRIIETIWTRDYSTAGLSRGNLAGATWQACALYRKTGWVGPDVLARRDEKRGRRQMELGDWTPARACDNPARLFWAAEAAAEGLSAPAVLGGRGGARATARRARGKKRMPAIDRATARECLTGIAAN